MTPETLGEYHLGLWLDWLERPCFVYVIQEQGGDSAVKVGRADDVAKRVAQLQTGNPHPLRLIYVLPGAGGLEADLHLRFEDDHLRGEWFAPTTDLDFVRRLALWTVAGYRQKGRVPHHREFENWPRTSRRSRESLVHTYIDPSIRRAA